MPTTSILALACSAIFLGSFVTAHVVKTDLSFNKDALSKYALGENGWVISIGLFSIGYAQISLSYALSTSLGFNIGNTLLTCAGTGSIVVAYFKMELPVKTLRGHFHRIGVALQFATFPLAILSLSSLFLEPTLISLTSFVSVICFFSLLLILYFFVTAKTHKTKYFGLIQKTNILFMFSWVTLVSLLVIIGKV